MGASPFRGRGDDVLEGRQDAGKPPPRRRPVTAALAGSAIVIAAAVFLLNTRHGKQEVDSPRVALVPMDAFPDVKFTDITAEAGIDFQHVNGAEGELLMPELFGSGCAFFDFDGDGDQDILLVNSRHWSEEQGGDRPPPTTALYRNDGNGHFDNATRHAGLDVVLYGMGVAIGDYDADGFPDVYLTAVGANRLFHNLGNGTFIDVTQPAGVAGGENQWSTSCGWFDYDNDDDLDLFVCTYVDWSRELDLSMIHELRGAPSYLPPVRFDGAYCLLYRNEGNGTFADVSAAAGLHVDDAGGEGPAAKALGVLGYDIDQDGWIDFVVANDQAPTFLFHNQRDGTFREIGVPNGVAFDRLGRNLAGMGIDLNELPNNRGLAIAIGNINNKETGVFASQDTRLQFLDEVVETGLAAETGPVTTFGLFFFDCDLDGQLDMLQANGSINTPEGSAVEGFDYLQPTQLFWYYGKEPAPFALVPAEKCGEALHRPILGRGAAYADIDADGDQDVLITENGGPALLLRNDQRMGRHWIRLRLVGQGGNREAIGARIQVRLGKLVLSRQVLPTRSYLSQMELPVTIGLGAHTRVDQVRIIWPDGATQVIGDIPVDALTIIHQLR